MPTKRRKKSKDYDRIDFRGLRNLRSITINPETDKPFTQGEIAGKAKLLQQTYSKIELGDTYNPSRDIVQNIAVAFFRSHAELLNSLPAREERKQEIVQQYIPNYSKPYNARDFDYFDGVLKDNAYQVEEPSYLRNCNGYAVTLSTFTMEPRYKRGDVLFVNPEIAPQRGDDVCIQLKYKDRSICLIREVIDMQPHGDGESGPDMFQYGVITAAGKDELRCKNYNENDYKDYGAELDFLLPELELFLAGDEEIEYQGDDPDEAQLWEDFEPDPSAPDAIHIHAVVGSQRYRSPRERRHVYVEPKSISAGTARVGQVEIVTTDK